LKRKHTDEITRTEPPLLLATPEQLLEEKGSGGLAGDANWNCRLVRFVGQQTTFRSPLQKSIKLGIDELSGLARNFNIGP
jgi:hypothetical protein